MIYCIAFLLGFLISRPLWTRSLSLTLHETLKDKRQKERDLLRQINLSAEQFWSILAEIDRLTGKKHTWDYVNNRVKIIGECPEEGEK